MMTMIQAVTFDADGTLWDFEQAMRQAQAAVLDALRHQRPDCPSWLTVERLMAIRDDTAVEMEARGATLIEIRLAAFERTLELIGAPDRALAAELNALYLEQRVAATRLYDDTVAALDALSHLTLGIISNGNTDPNRCGLAGRFRFALFADQYGRPKPHRQLFDAALEAAACEPAAVLHVGDSLTHDVAGAQAVGIRGIWLNREGIPNTAGIVPNAEIQSLLELPALLDEEHPAWRTRPGG
ncbi:MAG: HAD family hydrolase [Chloroflexi bacterium]|nr:HAD family hydrolase [Chloroflexota bacterium]